MPGDLISAIRDSRFHRRACLRSLVGGSLLLPAILSELAAAEAAADPLAPKSPHFPPKAKRVIFIFSSGGVSHMDTFDYKPKLYGLDGQTIPIKTFGRGGKKAEGRVVGPKWKF